MYALGSYLTGTITTTNSTSDLPHQPGGSAGKSLINFAPNVEILKFLKATNPSLAPVTEETFRNTLKTGRYLLVYIDFRSTSDLRKLL